MGSGLLRDLKTSSLVLTVLELASTHIGDDDAIHILSLAPRLREVDFSGCASITDDTVAAMGEMCPELEVIRLAFCAVTDHGMSSVAARGLLPNLRVAAMGRSHHEEPPTSPTSLLHHHHHQPERVLLEGESKGGTSRLGEGAALGMIRSCPNIQALSLRMARFTPGSLQRIATAISDMRETRETREREDCCTRSNTTTTTTTTSSEGGGGEFQGKVFLESLDLCGALSLSPLSLRTSPRPVVSFPQLISLQLGHAQGIHYDELASLLSTGCPVLERLNLSRLDAVDDSLLPLIAEGCPRLRELLLKECKALIEPGGMFRGFVGYNHPPEEGVLFPRLESLDIRGSYSGMSAGEWEEYRGTVSYRYGESELVAGVDPHLRYVMLLYSERGCHVQYGEIGGEGGRDSDLLWGNTLHAKTGGGGGAPGRSPFGVQYTT